MNAHQYVPLAGSRRPPKNGSRRLRDADPASHVEVTLTLRAPALPDASRTAPEKLSRTEFAAEYGAKQVDADKVAKALEKFGLRVDEVSLPAASMRVSGTVAQMNAAFQTHLGIYRAADQGDYRGREGILQIPNDVEGIVTGVFGLDDRRVARRKATRTATHGAAAKSEPLPLGPNDLEKRYSFPANQGKGQQIGIAEFGGGYFADDLQAFCTKYGLTMPNITTVPVGLSSLTLAQIQTLPTQQRKDELESSIEVNMDIQIVAGLCPQADIFVYFAPFSQKGWVDLLNAIIAGNPAKPVVLSVSWGLAEDSPDWSKSALTQINARLQAAAMLGITVCVSSGDDGSGDELTDGRAHVDFPSSSPFVLSVGGTMLTDTIEQVWWETPGERTSKGGGAGGGGVSVAFQRPQWQNVQVKSLNDPSIDGRVIPDVTALAGPPLYDLIFMGRDFPNGGTSASTPLWAALIARINAGLSANLQQRFLTPLLYANGANGQPRGKTGCVDITVGQNASHPEPGVGYQAQPGFDAVSGWGAPNGTALLKALQ
jgi:kumamolisin